MGDANNRGRMGSDQDQTKDNPKRQHTIFFPPSLTGWSSSHRSKPWTSPHDRALSSSSSCSSSCHGRQPSEQPYQALSHMTRPGRQSPRQQQRRRTMKTSLRQTDRHARHGSPKTCYYCSPSPRPPLVNCAGYSIVGIATLVTAASLRMMSRCSRSTEGVLSGACVYVAVRAGA